MARQGRRWRLIAAIGVVTAAGILAWLWVQNEIDVRTMGVSSKVISRDGTAIAFTTFGRGPALILVDGAFCYRQNGPTPNLAPLLAEHFTIYAYDRRARGESGNNLPYTVEREIEDLAALIDAAGGSAFVFGMSSGAGIVLRAAESGLGIKKLALYEPPYLTRDGKPRSLEKQKADLQQLVSSGDRSGAVTYFMTEVFGAPKFFIHLMRLFMRSTWAKNESVAHTLPYDLDILSDWSVLTAASSIEVPALVIGGARSSAELQEAVKTVARAIPRSRQRLLEGQSHNVSMKVLAPVLTDFFSAK
jgi:pimeloyl-ACP methyl ester carboxylesterase